MKTVTLFRHQQNGVDKGLDILDARGGLGIFFDPGLGKTLTAMTIAHELMERQEIGWVIVVCPKTLYGTWQDQIATHTNYTPALEYNGTKEGQKKYGEALLTAERESPFILTNYEAWREPKSGLAELVKRIGDKALVVVDECFVAGTRIDTWSSLTGLTSKKIEDIVEGDLIINAMGVDSVQATIRKEVQSLVEIRAGGSRIVCSENHRFFTSNGWKSARDLRTHDLLMETGSSMRLLRDGVLPKESQDEMAKVLRNELFSEMANAPAGDTRIHLLRGSGKKAVGWAQKVLRGWIGFGKSSGRENQKLESHEESVECREDDCVQDSERDVSKGSTTGRERKGDSGSGERAFFPFADGLGNRISSETGVARAWLSNQLQARSRLSRNEDWHRSGWVQSRQSSGTGQEEGYEAGFVGVESVTVHEQGSAFLDQYRDSDGRIYCYDLKAKQHQSFSVNGVLVHNCSRIKTPSSQQSKGLRKFLKNTPYKILMTGTEITKSPLDLWAQFEFLRTNFWRMPFTAFKKTYGIWDDMYASGGNIIKRLIGFQNINELQRSVEPWIVRAKKEDCLDLPEKIFQDIPVELDVKEWKAYSELKERLMTTLDSGATISVEQKIALFTRFRTVTGGWATPTDKIIDRPSKVSTLVDMVEDTDEQAIIWCSFTHEIYMLQKELSPYGKCVTYHGPDSQEDRVRNFNEFTTNRARFFIANAATAGFGLNLQNCTLQYFYSLPTSSEQFLQALDRSHRIGTKSAVVYRFLLGVRGGEHCIDWRIKTLLDQSVDLLHAFQTRELSELVKFV